MKVLDVGNCQPDHASIRQLIEGHFDAEVVQAHGIDDALVALRQGGVSLILVNRLLDRDHSEGLEVIRRIKSDGALAAVPVMMVTNFDEAQQTAIEAGAVQGFGKLQLNDVETVELLKQYLR